MDIYGWTDAYHQAGSFPGHAYGSCLFGFGSVGTESGNKFLKFFDFSSFFLVGFLHLFDEKLAGFKPEIIVSGIQLNLAIIDIRSMSADFI